MRFPLSLWCTIVVLAIPIVASPSQDDSPVEAHAARSPPQVRPRTSLRLATSHSAALANSTSAPTVNTSVGSFQGTHLELANGSSQDIFYGIPYAQPPVGALRFARPQPVNTTASTVHNNTVPAKECYQPLDYGGVNRTLDDVSEDCLILDVYRPVLGDSGTNGSLLPVWLYIHGGAFVGGGAGPEINYSSIVETSVQRKTPIVIVAIQYRLGAFGFLGGAEVKAEAVKGENGTAVRNAGLHDQRQAIYWVHEHIRDFGGDPSKVTLVGESAGSISISLHLLANGGNTSGLYRAAIMQSGTANSVPSLEAESPTIQGHFDDLANRVACSNSTSNSTVLECLRAVDAVTFSNASNAVYNEINTGVSLGLFPWIPLRDDFFVTAAPSKLFMEGKFASHVPILSSDCLDEGTAFVPTFLNTTAQFDGWLSGEFLSPSLSDDTSLSILSRINELYPSDPADGSPYRPTNASDPFYALQYKRAASFFGDAFFEAPRRNALSAFRTHSPQTPIYAYLITQTPPGTPAEYGVPHTSDNTYLFGDTTSGEFTAEEVEFIETFRAQLVAFVVGLDPNGQGLPSWPLYGKGKEMLQLQVGNTTVVEDNFREEAIAYIISQQSAFLH
ncbi:hypothetical protein HWV62_14808 [Athelia sp. TMB]|nr:hypothetical protein HWV62_14808 [Athelia sp. TMB]